MQPPEHGDEDRQLAEPERDHQEWVRSALIQLQHVNPSLRLSNFVPRRSALHHLLLNGLSVLVGIGNLRTYNLHLDGDGKDSKPEEGGEQDDAAPPGQVGVVMQELHSRLDPSGWPVASETKASEIHSWLQAVLRYLSSDIPTDTVCSSCISDSFCRLEQLFPIST